MAMGKPDTSDVDYDAYLINDRTLADPEVVRGREKRDEYVCGSSTAAPAPISSSTSEI